MERPSLRTYARHILRFGNRRVELGILLLSALNVALLLALFGVLTSIASQLAFGGEVDGPSGFVPDAIAELSLPVLMGIALLALLLSFAAALALRLLITAEAYRMLERATVAAFGAMRRESKASDAHIREYPALLKNSVRFMSMAYLQGIALMFPVFLVVGIVTFGLFVQPVLTLAIAGAAFVSIPVFLWQSRRGQLNSERLAKTLVTRSAHLGRYVTNLLRHPSREVADGLDVRGYLHGSEGRAFRDSYVHRQRVGAYSTAVSTLGTVLGLAVVFTVLLLGPDDWFNLPGLVLAVLMFRVLESNFGSIMKLLGNLRATVPFTTAAVNLFEREADGFPDAELSVVDVEPALPTPSPLGAMVLCDLPWTREAAARIARALEEARGTRRPVFALAGDFDLVRGRVGEELHPIGASPKLLYPFDTLARAADFLELPEDARTQEAWEHLSPKGRFVLACLAERTRLEDAGIVLALNASDVGLLTAEERTVLPWVFDRQGTVLVFESIPPATRLPDSLDLLSYDGRRLRRHGTVADYDSVVEGIYSELVLGLGTGGAGEADGEADLLAMEELDELGVEDTADADTEGETADVSPRLRVGYAPEIETTLWYERWLMVRGRRAPPKRNGDGETGGGAPPQDPDPHLSTFGLSTLGREAAAAADQAERERLEATRLAEREANREEAAAARERLVASEEAMRAAKAEAERSEAARARAQSLLEAEAERREESERRMRDAEARLLEHQRESATSARLAEREADRAGTRAASRDEALSKMRAARDEALKAQSALQRELDTERKAQLKAKTLHSQALAGRDAKVEAARSALRDERAAAAALSRDLEAERKAREKLSTKLDSLAEASANSPLRAELATARKAEAAARRKLEAERGSRAAADANYARALEARDGKIAAARDDVRAERKALAALKRELEAERKARRKLETTASAAPAEDAVSTLRNELKAARAQLTELRRELNAERAGRAKSEAAYAKSLEARDQKVASARGDLRETRKAMNALQRKSGAGGKRADAERASLLGRVKAARAEMAASTAEYRAALRERARQLAAVERERNLLAKRVEALESRLREWEG